MDNITVDPCKVCGGTELNLVDGFYYCVECGTQDATARQTIIEDKPLADGTFSIRYKKKVVTQAEEKEKMSGEWYKWHAFNYILVGLAEELIAAGAKPSFKMKLLWIWTEYIKIFQNKEELGLVKKDLSESHDEIQNHTKKEWKPPKICKDIKILKRDLIFSMLYVALNLDGSELQLSDLFRFIKEGRLDIKHCTKYVPEEIDTNLIPEWRSFFLSRFFGKNVLEYSISLLKYIGIPPRMPDINKLVDRYTKELCLPEDFKELVLALMLYIPFNFIMIDKYSMKYLRRLPAYECSVMAYFLIAFKMCFGLDDEYEMKLSEEVDKINHDNSYMKSYRFNGYSEPSDRLFSFKEWCDFIQLRRIVLSKYYLHMAEEYLLEVDDYVYMAQFHGRNKTRPKHLSDEITMNLLDKIPQINKVEVIPKSEFKPTITPLTTYTDLIIQYYNDPELRLLFSEDFSRYSIEYVCKRLNLKNADTDENLLVGVSASNKSFNTDILGGLECLKIDTEIVYVRNCENKHWVKTKQPTVEHIKILNDSSDKESDHGYDSNAETASSLNDVNSNDTLNDTLCTTIKDEIKLEKIEIEIDCQNIFDDEFVDLKTENDEAENAGIDNAVENNDFHFNNVTFDNDMIDDADNYDYDNPDLFFNPETFDRDKAIRELMLATCKKYKIRVPNEYRIDEPKIRKRKEKDGTKAGERNIKRRKRDPTAANSKISRKFQEEQINKMLTAYYNSIDSDVLLQVSEHVKSVVNDVSRAIEQQNLTNIGNNEEPNQNTFDEYVHDEVDERLDRDEGSSVQCSENAELESKQDEGDPKFNDEKYDIKQLYVGVDDVQDIGDTFNVDDDPDIAAIIDKKIDEINKVDDIFSLPSASKEQEKYDSDDEMPLSDLKEKLEIKNCRKTSIPLNLESFIMNSDHVHEFKYWIRAYGERSTLVKTLDMFEQFNRELNENFPKSFYFVLKECAKVVNCSPYQIYKTMLNLEQKLHLLI